MRDFRCRGRKQRKGLRTLKLTLEQQDRAGVRDPLGYGV